MNVDEINTRLSALVVAMMDKGLHKPEASFWINANANYKVALGAGHGYGKDDHWYNYPNGDTPIEALEKAFAIIAAMPDPETAKLHRHMARVADCVDKAKADNIADEYVTPLRMTIAAMTENLLTYEVVK